VDLLDVLKMDGFSLLDGSRKGNGESRFQVPIACGEQVEKQQQEADVNEGGDLKFDHRLWSGTHGGSGGLDAVLDALDACLGCGPDDALDGFRRGGGIGSDQQFAFVFQKRSELRRCDLLFAGVYPAFFINIQNEAGCRCGGRGFPVGLGLRGCGGQPDGAAGTGWVCDVGKHEEKQQQKCDVDHRRDLQAYLFRGSGLKAFAADLHGIGWGWCVGRF
jgi:hypothetical protein